MTTDQFKILIVEDEALIAEYMSLHLQTFGFEIAAVCHNYENAIAAIDNVSFDLLLTDINLGKGIDTESGIDVAAYCKMKHNKPIIFLTAYADADTIKKGAALQPSGYLVKPINENTLYATLQLAMENHYGSAANSNIDAVDFFYIKTGKQNIKVLWQDVYCAEALKNYVKLHAVSKQSNLLFRTSLINFEKNILPPRIADEFQKINRSQLIRKSIIESYTTEFIVTTHGVFHHSNEYRK